MNKRIYPITPDFFNKNILPIIEKSYIWRGRPPNISHYKVFCVIMYVLRTGSPWRDLPKCYGNWHTIYTRFKRGSEKGLWWRILIELQGRKKTKINIVMIDSTTMKVHRHGGGQKGGSNLRALIELE
jgi:transposase